MLKKIVIIGAGGFGKELALIVKGINQKTPTYEIMGYLDDGASFSEGVLINGIPWLGKIDWILDHKDEATCVCAIAEPGTKKKIMSRLIENGVVFESIIASSAYVADYTEIGQGCVIYGGVSISSNCVIGDGVLINQNTTVGHDVTIGAYTFIMPGCGISGGCRIGEDVKIGGHAFIIPGKKVGDGATLAAGSVVFSNVRGGTTVLGNPAKRMKELE